MQTQSALIELLHLALAADTGTGDHTSLATVGALKTGKAIVKAKQSGIIAGVEVAKTIFSLVDQSLLFHPIIVDGDEIKPGDIILTAEGNTRSLLRAERLVLNCMQRMSGVASLTRKFADEISGLNSKVLDTRKTTPNFRVFEKMAVVIGGGFNHRFGLYDMILIKDNHVDAAGGIKKALENSKSYLKQSGLRLKIEIETRNLEEVVQVIETGIADRIMLDNFDINALEEAIRIINGRFETEASGGITLETIRRVAMTGVNYISVGALTHSYTSLDINMKIK